MPTTIDSLPFETTSYIFNLCADAEPEYRPPTLLSTSLSLGRVCRRLRRIAVTTPQLWTKIHVKCCNALEQFDLRAACAYLSLCGVSSPLSLHLYYGDIGPGYGEPRDSFNKLVIPHSTRWNLVDLQFFIHAEGGSFILKTLQGFPSLTELRVSLPSNCEPPPTYFSSRYENKRIANLRSLLRLSLNFECSNESMAYHAGIVIVESLSLPSMTTFTLILQGEDAYFRNMVWIRVPELLEMSGHPSLRSIQTAPDSNPHGMILCDLLKLVPLLEHAIDFYLDDAPMEILSNSSGDGIGLNLEELYFYKVPKNVDSFIQMLQSRWLGGEGVLREVHLASPDSGADPNRGTFLDRAKTELPGLKVLRNVSGASRQAFGAPCGNHRGRNMATRTRRNL